MTIIPPAHQVTQTWVHCTNCTALLYRKRFERALLVCARCGHHAKLTAQQRIEQLFDPGSAEPITSEPTEEDPLGFVHGSPYVHQLAKARQETGLDEAVIAVRATVDGRGVVAAVMDFRFLGGSMGSEVGERITAAAETALETRRPLVLVTASGGARMQEGAFALMQMVKTSQALAALDEAGVLTISVITDPTYGGVAASFATLADVIIAEQGARLGFAGRRVIEQTLRQCLPEGFQTAEFLLEHGLIDQVRPRAGVRAIVSSAVACFYAGEHSRTPRPAGPAAQLTSRWQDVPDREPWQCVRAARDLGRPTTADYANYMLDGFQELRGDRASGDCRAIVGGIGRLDGRPIVLIGHQRGHDTAELMSSQFGMASPAGYRKAARLMRLANKLGFPIVTLIDTPGAHPGAEAEERGQAIAIAESIRLMATLPVPIIAVVTGEGGSGGALALGVADRVFALSNAVYSVISPEGCAAILWRSAAAAPQAAAALQLDSRALLRNRIIDGVLLEPSGGAQCAPALTGDRLRHLLTETFGQLDGLNGDDLIALRRKRFRRYGFRQEQPGR